MATAAPESVWLHHVCGECRETEFIEPNGRFHPVCGPVNDVAIDAWPDQDTMVIRTARRTVARGQQCDAGTKSTPVIARIEDTGVGPANVFVYTSYTCRDCFAKRPREKFRCAVCTELMPVAVLVEVNAAAPWRTQRWCADCVRETPAYVCSACHRPCAEFAAAGNKCASCAAGLKRCGECGDAWHKETFDRCFDCSKKQRAGGGGDDEPPAKRPRGLAGEE